MTATTPGSPPTAPPHATCILFSKEYVKDIERLHRIPPTSIGVRRIRPSSKAVVTELKRQKRAAKKTKKENHLVEEEDREDGGGDVDIQTDVNSTGVNNLDSKINTDGVSTDVCDPDCNDNKKVANVINDDEIIDDNNSDAKKSTKRKHEEAKSNNDNEPRLSLIPLSNSTTGTNFVSNQQKKCYHQLTIDPQTIQEEIAELKCVDRGAYNNLPAVMSPPMTYQAYKHGLLKLPAPSNVIVTSNNDGIKSPITATSIPASALSVVINDELARRWSEALQKVIQVEEIKRNEEDLRPLVYRLMPEVWTRLRPPSSSVSSCAPSPLTVTKATRKNPCASSDNATEIGIREGQMKEETELDDRNRKGQNNHDNNNGGHPSMTMDISKSNSIIICKKNIRMYNHKDNSVNLPTNPKQKQASSYCWYNKTHEIVYDCLYNQFPNIHVSCGAKFGCDYLIYDGCRMERHAFAGLRIICATERDLNKILPNRTCSRNDSENDNRAGGGDDGGGELFPLPTPYELSGYVRVLNTAGKLALLAMVVKSECATDTESELHKEKYSHPSPTIPSMKGVKYNVAFVDLALEPVPEASAHIRKRAKRQSKRIVGLHLNKK